MKKLATIFLILAAWAAAPAALVAQDETPAPPAPPVAGEPQIVAPAPADEPALEAAVESPAVEEAVATDEPVKSEVVAEPEEPAQPEKQWVRRNEMVGIGQDVHVKANERVGQVVAIFGNVIIDGKVDNDLVVIGGRATINGPVGEMVLVLSNGELGPEASVRRDAVVVGGRLSNPHGVSIGGSTVSIEQHFPQFGAGLDWFRQGLVMGRPMVPSLRITWIVAGAFLAFYLFLALILGRAVNATAATLETRPGGTLLAALLFLPGFPLCILALSVTGIGLLLVPFLMIGVFFAALFGKAAFLAFVGRAVLRSGGEKMVGFAVLTTLIGGIIVTLLYGIWYLGFALWALTTWIGIGMVLMTILNAVKRERPKTAPAAPTPPPPAAAAPMPAAPKASADSSDAMTLSAPAGSGLAGGEPGAAAAGFVSEPSPGGQPPPQIPPVQPAPPPLAAPVSPVGYERANFGIRLAAILIDTILVGVVVGSIGGGGVFPLFLGVYCALLWFYRGTTVGGIICGLKLVRLDARPMDFATAIVRTLGAYLSVICVGLGFLWVIWDPEKQTWHDKIAGTTVVRVPKGMSLV
ncbi:MAG TPA: RDD family protein [Burkholderiales bacterium]|nr:RDD family protein [Burkholderiales bacterium]